MTRRMKENIAALRETSQKSHKQEHLPRLKL